MDETTKQSLLARYRAAAHKMQTGVAFMMERDGTEVSSKHLRVGVNSALVDSGALAQLLIRKGVITEEEYLIAIVEAMEAEADKYEKRVQNAVGPHGRKITLG